MSIRSRGRHGGAGSVRRFDSNGNKIGYSRPNISGGYIDYDRKGRAIGTSKPNSQGGYDHYDGWGNKVGSSDAGDYVNKGDSRVTHNSTNYRPTPGKPESCSNSTSGDSSGNSPSTSGQSNSSSSNQGCYVATCVYGSYDCPQVWTLRRFRDNTLANTILGRTFIRTYYAVSPTIVKWYGENRWFKTMWKYALDRMVGSLNANGVEATPYHDKDWE